MADTELRTGSSQSGSPPPEEPDPGAPEAPRRSLRRMVTIVFLVFFAVVVYAFGYEVTDVNLDEIKSETRRTQLVRRLETTATPTGMSGVMMQSCVTR